MQLLQLDNHKCVSDTKKKKSMFYKILIIKSQAQLITTLSLGATPLLFTVA